jgi:hypothetical protein
MQVELLLKACLSILGSSERRHGSFELLIARCAYSCDRGRAEPLHYSKSGLWHEEGYSEWAAVLRISSAIVMRAFDTALCYQSLKTRADAVEFFTSYEVLLRQNSSPTRHQNEAL